MVPDAEAVLELPPTGQTAALLRPGYSTKLGASMSLEWLSTATDDSPARLRATLTNQNEYRAKFQTHWLPPFESDTYARLRGWNVAESSLHLVPTETNPLADEPPEYEQRPSGHWHIVGVPPEQPGSLWLDAEESVTGEYYFLGGRDDDGVSNGRYEFGDIEFPRNGFSIVLWDTDEPGPTGSSRLEGTSFPSFADSGASFFSEDWPMSWYHEADATTEVYLEPSTEEAVIPGRIDFTLTNYSADSVYGNPKACHLLKFDDGEWYSIEPSALVTPGHTLYPGSARTDALRVFTGDPVRCDDGVDVGYLGGGRYAFSVGAYDDCVYAAAFDLLGDPLTVTPTDAVEIIARDDNTVKARSPRGDADDEYARRGTYTVTRVAGDHPEATRYIPEQVVRRQPLRDALGLLLTHGVSTVTVEEYTLNTPLFGVSETTYFRYAGDVCRISTAAVDDSV
ncbi:hypothetical protein [Halogranum rubrum]|uniref:Uncharacterized protein n=1 Tax=Halogranum salarium B-1 TaxID=1210908 RepID=J2ZFV2_9EURY|nr:hypothetical protein [Halogranum salarium]EJN59575.1 hypothetical protein HSB1_17330 [Halogranum salarium B-1]